ALGGPSQASFDLGPFQVFAKPDVYPAYRWRPNIEYGGRRFTNNLGLVMDDDVAPVKPAGVVRVVTVGASTTQGRGLAGPEHSYPEALQQQLRHRSETANWEVINAGHQGYTYKDTLALLREVVLPLAPDMLVYYGEVNDVARLGWMPYYASPHPWHVTVLVHTFDAL